MQQQFQSLKEQKNQLNKKEKRYAELNGLVKKLYESYAKEKISEKNFEMLSADYEAEQESLEADISELKERIEAYNENMDNTNQFLEVAGKYTDFSVLTAPMLNEFIEKIVVHSPVWNEGARTQEVEIYFKKLRKWQRKREYGFGTENTEEDTENEKRQKNLPSNRQKSKTDNKKRSNPHNTNTLERLMRNHRSLFIFQRRILL